MNITKDDLKQIMEEILDSRVCERSEEHTEQHEWIRARISAEKLRQEFYREAAKTLIQWSLPVIAAGAYYWLQGHFKA